MLNEGSSIEQISIILGHSSFKTTQEYLKKFPEKLHKEALEKFRGVFRN
jgi:site-specific recombinase XerD